MQFNVLKSFLLLADFKDAVARGNGQHLSILAKTVVDAFLFNNLDSTSMQLRCLVSILQSEVLLSQAEAFNASGQQQLTGKVVLVTTLK